MFWDPTFILLLPAIILAFYAQAKVQSTYSKYSEVPARTFKTGAQVSRELLDAAGLDNISVQMIPGNLTDHYDPKAGVLRLSHGVYQSNSVAALGIAAHEAGHAIQHSVGYFPMKIRAAIVPVANFGSTAAWPLFLIGLIFRSGILMDVGILFFTFAVLFQLVTLPVELDASRRAARILEQGGYVVGSDIRLVKKVLNAAALTYIAATAMAVLQLLRLLILRNDRD